MNPTELPDQETILKQVRAWVDDWVVGLNLCPFAKRELSKGQVRFVVSTASSEEQLLNDLHHELSLLDQDAAIATSLLIHPGVLTYFYDYNQFLDLTDGLLETMGWLGTYQVASFHPEYQFHGTTPHDVENYTNRSPYPILHILREDQLEQRIADYPDTDAIPENNIRRMQELGLEQAQARLKHYLELKAN